MRWTVAFLMPSVLCLCPGSIVTVNGRVQMINMKVLEKYDDWPCPSVEERERARNEIHQVAIHGATHSFTCNGTPGWRCVAFINMTDANYSCHKSHKH